jgi:hypothetical protein
MEHKLTSLEYLNLAECLLSGTQIGQILRAVPRFLKSLILKDNPVPETNAKEHAEVVRSLEQYLMSERTELTLIDLSGMMLGFKSVKELSRLCS